MTELALIAALVPGICKAGEPQPTILDELKKGYWKCNVLPYQLLKGDTLIMSKSEERVWKFKPNGNVKGYDWVLYCSRVPKWRRNEHPWSKFGTWSSEKRTDGDFLHLDLYTGSRVLRFIESADTGMVFIVIEAPEKRHLD